MATRDMSYLVKFDVDGTRDLERAEKSLKELDEAVDDLGRGGGRGPLDGITRSLKEFESNADRAARALVDLAQDSDSELRRAAAAAEALSAALGPELTARADVDQIVADLQRMDLTFEEITADADKLAAALKQADDIRLQGLNDGIGRAKTGMGELRNSSDQSRSVLANLGGNVSQDLGELGGVVGSLGVGIGQLAEYAIDGNIALTNLAKVAGPMAAVAAAGLLISESIKGIQLEKQFRADLVDDFEESLRGATDAATDLFNQVRATGELEFADIGGLGIGTVVENVLPRLGQLGISFDQFFALVDAGVAGNQEAVDAFFAEMLRGVDILDEDRAAVSDVQQAVNQYADSLKKAQENQRLVNELLPLTTDRINDMLDAAKLADDPLATMSDHWRALIDDVKDGSFDFENAAGAITQLTEATGLQADEIVRIVQQKASEEIQAQADAAAEAAEAAAEHAEALAETSAALADVVDGLDTAALRADSFASAMEQINESTELTASTELVGFVDGLRGIGDAVSGLVDSGVDLAGVDLVPESWDEVVNMPDELRPVIDALSGFRDTMQTEFAQAFEAGGSAEARQWAENTRVAIFDQLHAAGIEAPEQINEILRALGLLPDQVEMTIEISKAEQAKSVLDSIGSVIDTLPREVQLQIAAVADTDPIAALQLAIDALEASGVQVPVELQVLQDQLEGDVNAAASAVNPTIPVGLDVDTSELDGGGKGKKLGNALTRQRTATITAQANTRPADTALDLVAAERRTANISVALPNIGFVNTVMNAFTGAQRTARVNVELGPLPRIFIAPIRVPVYYYAANRLEGLR